MTRWIRSARARVVARSLDQLRRTTTWRGGATSRNWSTRCWRPQPGVGEALAIVEDAFNARERTLEMLGTGIRITAEGLALHLRVRCDRTVAASVTDDLPADNLLAR
jgi:hypothetical protein